MGSPEWEVVIGKEDDSEGGDVNVTADTEELARAAALAKTSSKWTKIHSVIRL